MEPDSPKSGDEYVHIPCDAIDSPDNIIYPAVKDLVDSSLEFRIEQQNTTADGCSAGNLVRVKDFAICRFCMRHTGR